MPAGSESAITRTVSLDISFPKDQVIKRRADLDCLTSTWSYMHLLPLIPDGRELVNTRF